MAVPRCNDAPAEAGVSLEQMEQQGQSQVQEIAAGNAQASRSRSSLASPGRASLPGKDSSCGRRSLHRGTQDRPANTARHHGNPRCSQNTPGVLEPTGERSTEAGFWDTGSQDRAQTRTGSVLAGGRCGEA